MALIVEIKVVPCSGKNGWKLEFGRLKCYLKSVPEKNKANNELIGLIAKAVGVSAAQVTIVSGAIVRLKRVKIDADLSFDRLLAALGVERQIGLF